MKIKLLRDYMTHPPGAIVTFPGGAAELLIRRGIAEEVKADEPKKDKSQSHRKYRNK